MNRRIFVCMVASWVVAAAGAFAQSPRVLYTWKGTGNTQGWEKSFGDNTVNLANTADGELTVTETGGVGASLAIADNANTISEGGPSLGGLDLTGLSELELDLGHSGPDPVSVQFYVQAAPSFDFVVLGDDQAIASGDGATYKAPLGGLTPAQLTYVRVIGINIRDHADQGDLTWTLSEIRSAGTPLKDRLIVVHEADSSDGGLQGAYVNFENAAVEGNDLGQNQSGLTLNTSAQPPGNTGSLEWTDLAGKGGAAVSWVNGTVFGGDSFNERPADFSNYAKIVVRIAATNANGGANESLGLQYFFQTGNFNFQQAGANATLPADGEFHEIEFDISSLTRLDFVDAHGINLFEHVGGDLIIDVDFVQAVAAASITDCNSNGIDDERDVIDRSSRDCNENRIPDECDISNGTSKDCNANDTPDDCEITGETVTRLLYTWEGDGDTRGWLKNFGANDVLIESLSDGELTVTEISDDDAKVGTGFAVSDDANIIAEGGTSIGGLDLTGLSSIEIDLGHSGAGTVNVQFFLQATPDFTFIALGPDVAVGPEITTYKLAIDGLTPAQITYIRTIGLNVRDHLAEGNLVWTIQEVRATGVPLAQRDFATHGPGSSDAGLQGAVVAFDNAAVQGNDGSQNQTGLSHNTSASPTGNTGSLQWTDLAGQNGGAVTWFNGTAFGGNTFNERPTDMSPYTSIQIRMAATNIGVGAVESVTVQYFLQTGGFIFYSADTALDLPVDDEFHVLEFRIDGVPDLHYVDAHGIDLTEHAAGDLRIDVDNIRAVASARTANDCNSNGVPDSCDISAGLLHDANGNSVPDECEAGALFRRGDTNADSRVDISDAVSLLNCLFLGGACPTCLDAADSNDSGKTDLSDAVYTLNRLFLGGQEIPLPGTDACGTDPTDDLLEDCTYPPASCQ